MLDDCPITNKIRKRIVVSSFFSVSKNVRKPSAIPIIKIDSRVTHFVAVSIDYSLQAFPFILFCHAGILTTNGGVLKSEEIKKLDIGANNFLGV